MAKKELPKAQLGAIIKMAKGAYQGIKTGYKTYKTASLAEKAAKLKKAQAAARAQKAAATKAANAAATKTANAAATKTANAGTTKTKTLKEKELFVKSKNRQRLENVSGKAVGALTYGTANITKKVLENRIAQGIIGGGITAYVLNRIAEGKKPVKIKKIKK